MMIYEQMNILERLRREVEELKLINDTWEIIARLAKERYNLDMKKLRGSAIREASHSNVSAIW